MAHDLFCVEGLFVAPRALARSWADAHLCRSPVARHHFSQNGVTEYRFQHGRWALASIVADGDRGLWRDAVLFVQARGRQTELTVPALPAVHSRSSFVISGWILALVGRGALRSTQAPAAAVLMSFGRISSADLRRVGLHTDPAVHARPPLLPLVLFRSNTDDCKGVFPFWPGAGQEPGFVRHHLHRPFGDRQRKPATRGRFLQRGEKTRKTWVLLSWRILPFFPPAGISWNVLTKTAGVFSGPLR